MFYLTYSYFTKYLFRKREPFHNKIHLSYLFVGIAISINCIRFDPEKQPTMNLRSILATLLFVTAFLSQALGSTYSDTTIYRRYRFCPDSCVTVSESRHIRNCPPCDNEKTKYVHDTLWRSCGGAEMPIYMINNCGGCDCDTTHGGGDRGGRGGKGGKGGKENGGGGGENDKPDSDYLKRVWEHLLTKLIDLFLDPKVFLTLLGIITGYFGYELKKEGEKEEAYPAYTYKGIFTKISIGSLKWLGSLLEFLAAFLFIIIAYEFLGILAYPIVIIFTTAVAGFLIFSAINEWKRTNEKAQERWLYDNDVRRSNERLEENKALQKQKNKLMQLYIELQANGKMSASTALKIMEKHFTGQDIVFDQFSVYRPTTDFLRELYNLTSNDEGEVVISNTDYYQRYINFLREYLSS